jgi:biopolymer transport protein ExbD
MLKDDILRYELNDFGEIIQAGRKLSAQEAETAIAAAIKAHPNLAVLLTVYPEAPWQSVVRFVEIAKKLSVNSFSFKMAEEAESE